MNLRWLKTAALAVFYAPTLVHSDAYLLIHFPSAAREQLPSSLALVDRHFQTPHSRRQGALFTHVPIKSNLDLLQFKPGRYLLAHFDYDTDAHKDKDTLHLGRELTGRFLNERVYYFGDIEVRDEGISYRPNPETVRSACKHFPEIATMPFFLIFNEPKPIEIDNPCR